MEATTRSKERFKHNQKIGRRLGFLEEQIFGGREGVHATDSRRQTALHLLAQYWAEDLSPDVSQVATTQAVYIRPLNAAGALVMAKFFLAKRAAVDQGDYRGRTPLHFAVKYNNLSMVSLLLIYKANVNTADISDVTPLHIAQWSSMSRLLLENGALVNARDSQARRPLHYAVDGNHLMVANTLLDYEAGINFTDKYFRGPLHFVKSRQMAELLLANRAIVDARTKNHSTPLHEASARGLHEVVQVLLKSGANVHARDDSGNTALHRFIKSGPDKQARIVVRLLLESGINPNAENYRGYTALQKAIRSMSKEKTLALLEQNIQAYPQSASHQTFKAFGIGKRAVEIGRLLDASIKLRAANFKCTRRLLTVLTQNQGQDYSLSSTLLFISNFGARAPGLKLKCEAEVKKLRSHMLTDTMSMYDFLLIDNARCVFSKPLLDALQSIDFGTYPTYECLLVIKFKELDLMMKRMLKVCQ